MRMRERVSWGKGGGRERVGEGGWVVEKVEEEEVECIGSLTALLANFGGFYRSRTLTWKNA